MRAAKPATGAELRTGLEACIEQVVPPEWTISTYDSRLPPVLSTPAMNGMMEVAAAKAVQPYLPRGSISVGTRIEVDHLKAVPADATVRTSARLSHQEGRFLVFEVEARSGEHVIGRGRVFRTVVDAGRFHKKAAERHRV